jgi:hypothetical protein
MPENYQFFDAQQKRAFWETHVEQWQRSELSQSAYCRHNDLKAHLFFYWRRRILEPTSDVSFVPLALPANRVANQRAADVRIFTPNGFTIEIDHCEGPAAFQQLVAMVADL